MAAAQYLTPARPFTSQPSTHPPNSPPNPSSTKQCITYFLSSLPYPSSAPFPFRNMTFLQAQTLSLVSPWGQHLLTRVCSKSPPPPLPSTFQQQSMSIPRINYPSYTLLKTLFSRTNSVTLLQPTRTPTCPLLPLSYPKKRPPLPAFPPAAPAWTHHGMGKTGNRPTGTGPDMARSPKLMD